MTTPVTTHSWRTELPFHSGNPQRQQQQQQQQQGQGHGRKQGVVEKPAMFKPTVEKQSSKSPAASWKAQTWLSSNEATFSSSKQPNDGGDDDTQTIATSMVAHASTASSEIIDERTRDESVATPKEHTDTLDRVYILESDAANNDYFRCMGDWQHVPRIFDVLMPNDVLDIKPPRPFDRDADIKDQQRWKSLADKRDGASGRWERTHLDAPRASSPSEPAPSLVTDCSTVESDAITTHQYPTGVSALHPEDKHRRPPNGIPVTDEGFEKIQKLHPYFEEVPHGTLTQHTGPRGRGRGRGRGDSRAGGSTSNGSTSHAHAASFGSSSSRAPAAIKRGHGGDDPDKNGQDNREPPKRAKPNDAENRRLTCLFYKKDPEKYIGCIQYYFTTTGDLKQHLRRFHGGFQCPTCGLVSGTRESSDQHIQQRSCHPISFARVDISEDTQTRIDACRPRNTTDVERWFLLWDIIFPNHGRPPSPIQLDMWPEICNIFLGKLGQSAESLTSRIVSEGCPQTSAHAVLQCFQGWLQNLRGGEANVSNTSHHSPDINATGDLALHDGSDQPPPTSTDAVHGSNSNPPPEQLPATESDLQQPNVPLDPLGLSSAEFPSEFPHTADHSHDSAPQEDTSTNVEDVFWYLLHPDGN